jgi:predicted nuclease of predicted toxin-antitoxin system
MIILDAHLPPSEAPWILKHYNIESFSATFLNLGHSSDFEIFEYAKSKNAIIITKDDDFIELNNKYGCPPKIIWLTCGNTSKKRLQEIFDLHLSTAFFLLKTSDIVEISGM